MGSHLVFKGDANPCPGHRQPCFLAGEQLVPEPISKAEPHAGSGLTADWEPSACWLKTQAPPPRFCVARLPSTSPSPSQTVPRPCKGENQVTPAQSRTVQPAGSLLPSEVSSVGYPQPSETDTDFILVKYLNFICWSSREDAIRFYSKRCFQS